MTEPASPVTGPATPDTGTDTSAPAARAAGGGVLVRSCPDPRLGSIVARDYCGWTLRADRDDRFVVPAHTSTQLVIKVEDSTERPSEFVHGALDGPVSFDGGCAPRYLQVDLTPLGAHRLLGIPLRDLRGVVIDLTDIIGAEGRRLGEAIRAADGWRARFGALDRFLLDRARSAPAPDHHVAFVWRELQRTAGAARIQDLCRAVGWSHRHLIDRFGQQVGLTPKRAARVIRFERLVDRLDDASPAPWADLAAECGYSDQAHLIREFVGFTGTTPAAEAGRA